MSSSANSPLSGAPCDQDLAEQAVPGHGVPSQDTNPAAQFPLEPDEVVREAQSVLMAGVLVGGIVLGCAVGALAAGPVGIVVGGVVGAIAGVLSGAVAGPVFESA